MQSLDIAGRAILILGAVSGVGMVLSFCWLAWLDYRESRTRTK